jgi:ABC-type molybdate transport system ATPase subunit
MTLFVDVRHKLGSFGIEARFETHGQLTALFGPSGSGKTSLINMIGGLLRPAGGRIEANGRVLSTRKRDCSYRNIAAASAMCSRTLGCFRI